MRYLAFFPIVGYTVFMALLFIICVVMMGGVAYLAISKKSTLKIRFAAIGALALMIVSVIVCMVVYSREEATPKQLFLPDMMPSDMPPPVKNSPVTMIMLIIFMIALFTVVFVLAMREQKRSEGKEPPAAANW